MIDLQATVSEDLKGKRFDQALAVLFPEYSRAQLTKWLKMGAICVNGQNEQQVRPKDLVRGGETIVMQAPSQEENAWQAEKLPLTIVYEDPDLLILNKPEAWVVHPAFGHKSNTLVNALLYHYPQLNALPRAGLIHRLDKGTSGLLVVAKTLEAQKALVAALQERLIKREYQAIVQGRIIGGATIATPIGRDPIHRLKMAVLPSGKPAVTHYRVGHRYGDLFTHLLITLETGRTHQIRVHMKSIGHPLVGDPLYGARNRIPKGITAECLKALQNLKRQALHAYRLSFTHPIRGTEISETAPLPEDMQMFLDAIAHVQ